jgi:lipoprotein-releasing system permease protein
MIRPLECFIGFRYLRTGRGRGLVSFMSAASLLGIMLGVTAIIVILSAMNGLEGENRERLLSMSEHIALSPEPLVDVDLEAARAVLASHTDVLAVTPFVRFEAVLSPVGQAAGAFRPVLVRGIDPGAEQGTDLESIIGAAALDELAANGNSILLGRFVAADLGVQPGDELEVTIPQAADGRLSFRRARVTVGAVFIAGIEAYDSNLVLLQLARAQRLAGEATAGLRLGVRLHDPMAVGQAELALREAVGPGFSWTNWATENRSLFQAMAIEKTMMTILMMFIVAVAAFNIVTSLTMVVNEKERDIGILRTLGLEPARVSRIFLVQGAVLGIGGTLAGVVAGILLAHNLEIVLPWLERTFGFRIMPGDVFYVSTVPSEISLRDVFVVSSFALIIALLATLLPSRRAARIDPADVLRYE